MKTHIIKEDGTVTTLLNKLSDLKAMQKTVDGYIEIVNCEISKQPKDLPLSDNAKEMVLNEEGLLRPDLGVNHVARKILAESLGVTVDEVQPIKGTVFVTDGWKIN